MHLDRAAIVTALTADNGRYFTIPDLDAYADKVLTRGHAATVPDDGGGAGPAAFVLYYDDGPDVFVTMAWTRPDQRRRGLVEHLLRDLIRGTRKPVRLDVHEDNPARHLYDKLGFTATGQDGPTVHMTRPPRVAIMQPYVFPYLGYFHLAEAADLFVAYDDVNYIKRGWINRNNLLAGGGRHLFTVPVSGGSQNALIRDVAVADDPRWSAKFEATLRAAYAAAPHRDAITGLVLGALDRARGGSIADLAVAALEDVYAYLGRPLRVVRSSDASPATRGAEKAERLTAITRQLGYTAYVNAPGGRALYDKADFASRGVRLDFVDSTLPEYPQGRGGFVPGLSIIDVLMWNDPDDVARLLGAYRLG